MRVLGVLMVVAVVANAQFCPQLTSYLATQVGTPCFYQLYTTVQGLQSVITQPTLLAAMQFPDIVEKAVNYTYNYDLDVSCEGLCAANYTTLINTLYGYASGSSGDKSCGLIAAGYELVCIKDNSNDKFCGTLNIPTVCADAPSCCVGSLQSFLVAAAENVPSLANFATLSAGLAYEIYCDGKVTPVPSSPALDTCEFSTGSQVTDDYAWRASFECDLDSVTEFFDSLYDDTDFSSYTDAQLDTCIASIKAITSTSASLLYAAGDDSVDFATVCEDCTEVIDAFLDLVESKGTSDTGCFVASGLLEAGCYHRGDDYCGDYFLGGAPSPCSAPSTAACCFVEKGQYFINAYDGLSSEASLVAAAIADASECGLSASQITNGFVSCALSNSLDIQGDDDAAAGISLRSIMSIVAAAVALAFMMLA